MFFAKKFCHCWRAADFAFAFAHHFYLPPALPGHFSHRLPGRLLSKGGACIKELIVTTLLLSTNLDNGLSEMARAIQRLDNEVEVIKNTVNGILHEVRRV